MEPFNILVCLLGGLVLILAIPSRWLLHSPFSPTLLALGIGIFFGPKVLEWIHLHELGNESGILENAARLTLGIGLVGVALRIPAGYLKANWRDMAILVGLGMPLMWLMGSLPAYWLLGVSFWIAALIGAIVAPTDPVAASPIVSGDLAEENLPPQVRDGISFDSGANDGLAYAVVMLPVLMLTKPSGEAWHHWLATTLLWEIGVTTVFGLLVGWTSAKVLQWAEKHGAIAENWRLIFTVAVVAIGGGRLIGSDEVLVALAAGMTFSQVVTADERKEEEHGQEAVNRFFAIPFLTLLGTALPWDGWSRPGLGGVLLAVAAVYYATLAEMKTGEELVWPAVSMVVVLSVIAHGTSAAPLTKRYGHPLRSLS